MSVNYSRPVDIEQATLLLKTNRTNSLFPEDIGCLTGTDDGFMLDLQDLPLSYIKKNDKDLLIGGRTLIESIHSNSATNPIISRVIAAEFGLNKRNRHTIGTILRTCSGKSLFMSLLAALDVKIETLANNDLLTIGQWIDEKDRRFLAVKQVTIPAYEYADIEWSANTPMSQPEISLAAVRWKGGRNRVVLGGLTLKPELVLDGTVTQGFIEQINIACSHYIPIEDSSNYYKNIISTLSERILRPINSTEVSV